jgi:hypothetical protein
MITTSESKIPKATNREGSTTYSCKSANLNSAAFREMLPQRAPGESYARPCDDSIAEKGHRLYDFPRS